MIRVPGDNPTTVSFVQKGNDTNAGRIASEQISKSAREEVIARNEFDNANYRLEKATEALRASEIAYQEAVAKSAWNTDEVRKSYNNALAGFREADRNAEIAAEKLAVAKSALAGLRSVAKAGISNGEELKAAVKNAKTADDRKACVDAAEKLKLMFFLPKGWKAEADKSVAKSTHTSAERASFADAEKQALAIKDNRPHLAMEILNNIADAYAAEAGQAKQAGDIALFQRLAAEGGRVRGLVLQIRQEGFDNKFPVQDVKDIAELPLEVVGKREFSTERRSNLAEEGKAMPDGSYPIVTAGDLKNAIQSYGRAADKDAVKAHIVARAEALGATDLLPEGWVSTKKSITKEVVMPDAKILVICPSCGGDDSANCPMCGGASLVSPEAHDAAWGMSDEDSSENPFLTKSLLTRDFEKSAAYQNYIFTKGGAGSGEGPGHPFRGNQHTGGISASGRLIHEREGHRVTMKRYEEGAAAHKSAAEAQKTIARGHESQGRFAKAAEAMRAAADHHKMAAGFHEGIAGIHAKVHGDEAARSEHRGEAAKQRVYQGRANAEADRLEAMAA